MIDRAKIGIDTFREGYNCSQSVLVAFEDVVSLSKEQLLDIGVALGGGFARTRNLCGAVNAMGIIYGLVKKVDKAQAYKEMQAPIEAFKKRFSSINCSEILKGVEVTSGFIPEDRTEKYYATRPCEFVVEYSIKLIQNLLNC